MEQKNIFQLNFTQIVVRGKEDKILFLGDNTNGITHVHWIDDEDIFDIESKYLKSGILPKYAVPIDRITTICSAS